MTDRHEAIGPDDAAAHGRTPAAQPRRLDAGNGRRSVRAVPLDPGELTEIELIRGDTTVIKLRPAEEPVESAPDSSNVDLPVPDYHKTPGTMTKRG